ncbi:5-dehydro-4-deoxy-D-glucuronate isomerase [Boudabousia liubingyangii]|uniref:4-deoxy-L-threo-5-hexosulose-uronate ketol-isomerase n=1 Tax=Boudabousia liubingyangii TaxID=1921764 RepID=A0A1Q5PMT1_9ACTO|nr:5-dehydro-4-deoxy-D-glucuronate isomerase [Boudabousia liubingyangii]OKL47442.1 5-dehydro-4-deoxy-D-glucuronate isomerase [Boudabousia liubingyangii]OKL48864.1 5-dehydro-4-deoxy-D-glucuronate isomerase [Boudabousia liubingyangii]
MQKLTYRHAHGPADIAHWDTQQLRDEFLIEPVFTPGDINITYSFHDRMLVAGVTPTTEALEVVLDKDLGTDFFLQERELGVINIGGPGSIDIDGRVEKMATQDGFYISRGTRHVTYSSDDPSNPAKFYLASAPAHTEYPTTRISIDDIKPLEMGDGMSLNERKIYQYVHPNVCQSAQLQMGLTKLAPGSAWNTMPAHTHARRMEVYLYFDVPEDARVFHLMGEPEATKHLAVGNEQAVISPSWSIHSGVGTSNYTFIWSMCGENKAYTDMDIVQPNEIL